MNKKIIAISLFSLLLFGCGDNSKQEHKVDRFGNERGVRIEVLLKGGGSAVLVCPKFKSQPLGFHGRDCYLDQYDSRIELKTNNNNN